MVDADNKTIEIQAVSIINTILSRCRVLMPYISINDKTPSLDGWVEVFNSTNLKKENSLGRIAVQVKGTGTVFKEKQCSYSIDVSDLECFRNESGCILFLVSVDLKTDNYKVYYCPLQVFDLNRILDGVKRTQKKTLTLIEFPQDTKEITNVLLNFLIDSKRQSSFKGGNESIQALVSNRVPIKSITSEVNMLKLSAQDEDIYVSTHPQYLYATIEGVKNKIPVDKVDNITITRTIHLPVMIGDKRYYDHFNISTVSGIRTYKIGRCISIIVDRDQNCKVGFNPNGDIDGLVVDVELFVEWIKNGVLSVGSIPIRIDCGGNQEVLSTYENFLFYLNKTKKILRELGFQGIINLDGFKQEDYYGLFNLIELYDRKLPYESEDDSSEGPHVFYIGNLYILLWDEEGDGGKRYLENFYEDHSFDYYTPDDKDKKNKLKYSHCLFITSNTLCYASNLDIDYIYQDIISKDCNVYYLQEVSDFIKAVDLASNQRIDNAGLINLASRLKDWMKVQEQLITD